MFIHYVEYEKATGLILLNVSVDAYAPVKTPERGNAIIQVPFEAKIAGSNDLRLDVMKPVLAMRVDAEAGATRRPYLTTVEGQDLTYIYKSAEARAFAADPASPTPFIAEEAAMLGVSVQAVVDEVLAAISLWTEIGKRIEGRRRAANVAISAATTVAQALVAGDVDWGDLRAPAA